MRIVIIIIIFLLSNMFLVFAQQEKEEPIHREGFIFGIAAGGGALLIKDKGHDLKNYNKFSILNLKLGWMVTPETAVCLHVPSGGHKENGNTRAFEAIMITGQHWFSNRFWGSAGVGMSMDMPPFYDTDNDDPDFYFGTGLCTGIGYEIWRKGKLSIDLQGRCLYGYYDVERTNRQSTAFDILIGINWN